MNTLERSDKRNIKTIDLITGSPLRMTLGEEPINLATSQGQYIASAVLHPQIAAVKFFNRDNGQHFEITTPGSYIYGAENFPKGFLTNTQKYVSYTHFRFDLIGFKADGRAQILLQDLISTNGTKIIVAETDEPDKPGKLIKVPETSRAGMLAGGQEGYITSVHGDCAAITEKGLRDNNEDAVLISPGMIAVSDGIGGYAAGEKASRLALQTLQKKSRQPITQNLFKEICSEFKASEVVRGQSGCTLAIARKTPGSSPGHTMLEIGHVGDSKVYVLSLSGGGLLWTSKDQSIVQHLLDNKTLDDPIYRYTHPKNSIITNCINLKGLGEPAEIWSREVPTGRFMVIICSDGVSDFVTPEEVTEIGLRKRQFCIREIVDLAFSRQGKDFQIKLGGRVRDVNIEASDNASAAVMMV